MPIRCPHHDDVDLDALEPVDAVHPRALDPCVTFERHAERSEECGRCRKVVDDDADVVQSLDRHVTEGFLALTLTERTASPAHASYTTFGRTFSPAPYVVASTISTPSNPASAIARR